MIARVATFEGGDAEEMRRLNNEMLVERGASAVPPGTRLEALGRPRDARVRRPVRRGCPAFGWAPPGTRRVMVLMKDESRWSVISFFDDAGTAAAAEEQWERMGDEVPESVRGKRIGLESYEVAFDVEMVR